MQMQLYDELQALCGNTTENYQSNQALKLTQHVESETGQKQSAADNEIISPSFKMLN